jgi:hypothetical protein
LRARKQDFVLKTLLLFGLTAGMYAAMTVNSAPVFAAGVTVTPFVDSFGNVYGGTCHAWAQCRDHIVSCDLTSYGSASGHGRCYATDGAYAYCVGYNVEGQWTEIRENCN